MDSALKNATDGKIDKCLKDIVFDNGDLKFSIHKANIHVQGYLQNDSSWKIYATLTDVYDFTEIQSFMSDSGFSKQAGLGTIANDLAFISQKTGAINTYKITVDFITKRKVGKNVE